MRLARVQQILQPGNGLLATDEAGERGGQVVLVRCDLGRRRAEAAGESEPLRTRGCQVQCVDE
jgi:hypothetical protein